MAIDQESALAVPAASVGVACVKNKNLSFISLNLPECHLRLTTGVKVLNLGIKQSTKSSLGLHLCSVQAANRIPPRPGAKGNPVHDLHVHPRSDSVSAVRGASWIRAIGRA